MTITTLMSGCFSEVLPDPTCFNQASLPIPKEISETKEPALIFQFLSKEPNHCVNASDESAGLERCREFYLDKLGYLNSGEFASLELVQFVPINDQYRRCELRCDAPSCACLFDYDCGRSEMNEPLRCQWIEANDEPESACRADTGCTLCE